MTAPLDTSVPGELPHGTTLPPVSGGPVARSLSDVDRRITLAFGDLALARSRFADSPSGESITACVRAETTMNELLELRLSLTAGPPPGLP
jgi:hypothetical protein